VTAGLQSGGKETAIPSRRVRSSSRGPRAPAGREPGRLPPVRGVWLTAGSVREPIETVLVEMLAPSLSTVALRESVVEELGRPAKLTEVVLDYLGLRSVEVDDQATSRLLIVTPRPGRDPWRERLIRPGGDCPIGFVVDTADQGRLVLLHEVFANLGRTSQQLVRRYAAWAVRGRTHEWIIERLRGEFPDMGALLVAARRQVQVLDPSVAFSPDGRLRVQLGSLSQTTRNLLREGVEGDQLFILPANLFEAGTNQGDVEFLIYLNFFARRGIRTRLAGTARQRDTLARLLTLTIFGLFEPGAPLPSFEVLRERFHVPDPATYAFFRMAYEMFGVRAGSAPDNPILTVSDYIDYTVLDDAAAMIGPIAGAEVWVSPAPPGFDVRISGSDGRVTAKRLQASTPHRVGGVIPDDRRHAIRFATDRPRFGVTPLGTSHGFDPAGDLTSFVIWIGSHGILVDPSPESLIYLDRIGVAPVDIPYVFLTHVHADHDGGLIEKLLSGRRTTVVASDVVFRAFVEKARLITGHTFESERLVRHLSANPGHPVWISLAGERVMIETRWNLHPIPTNGFRLRCGDRTFGYSGDTKYDPQLLAELRDTGRLDAQQYADLAHFFWTPEGEPTVDLLYHEAGVPPIHTNREHLAPLPETIRRRTWLVHVADREVPPDSVPAKPPLFATQVLLPATPESRERALIETVRLIGYLYDIPSETLRELTRGAELVGYQRDDLIVRKGGMRPAEPLHFFVVADGLVAVRDGRRVIAHLVKGDSFGEWGISHQRGFRVADVSAVRSSLCIRFTEAQYQWLVGRHPVIQDRISRIRALLPRLQLAQERAGLRRGFVRTGRGVLEAMTANQLASFALFSEVRAFRKGQEVLVEGDRSDGFYTLLSGHLVATMEGRPVGELLEGDVFGEMGLLEGGARRATITVVSTDAEALYMSTPDFHQMVNTVPAFAWGIWETAADRRGVARETAST